MQSVLSVNRVSIAHVVAWVIGLVVISPPLIDFFGSTIEPEPSRPEVSVVVQTVQLSGNNKFLVTVQYGNKKFSYYPDDGARSGLTWDRAKSLLPGDVLNCKPTARMGRVTGWRYVEAYPIYCNK